MTWSFDDRGIGKKRSNGSVLCSRIIPRPKGLTRDDWYRHASMVARLLNNVTAVREAARGDEG